MGGFREARLADADCDNLKDKLELPFLAAESCLPIAKTVASVGMFGKNRTSGASCGGPRDGLRVANQGLPAWVPESTDTFAAWRP